MARSARTIPATGLSTAKATRLVAGCMTGTSLDGLDTALLAITGRGLKMQAVLLRTHSLPLGPLAGPLRELAQQGQMSAGQIAALSYDFALLHAQALEELLAGERPELVAVHGQTVFHAPPLSWQLLNPAPIAARLNVPVVFDLRAADLAQGGQGAPITPLADAILFGVAHQTRCIVNLGGFCNVTRLPQCSVAGRRKAGDTGAISGGDVCVCNQLLDLLARDLLGEAFDSNGARAAAGRVREKPYAALLGRLQAQTGERRSLGTGDEVEGWLREFKSSYPAADLARTACGAIAQTIAAYCGRPDRLLVAGGGARNRTLLAELRSRAGVPVELCADYGIPEEYREAAGMAVLGALCQDGVPITLPQVTGVKSAPVGGAWVGLGT